MAYNELSLTGSDDDLGALETKYPQQDLASKIPGQTSAARQQAQPQAPKSLIDRAAAALMQAHPLMMGRSLVDTTKSFIGGMAVPVVAPYSAGIQALNAAPGNMYRRSRGEEEVKTPTAEELMRKYGEAVAPQTEMGEGFIGGVGKLMEVLKVPHAFPVVPNAPRRPMLTPTDVRVGAGQAKQLAREVREVPQDFQNAQSGLKRQNLYGEDTLGVKAQAAAESLGDTLERRKSSGKSAIPGVPGQLVPETNLYAVRPGKGTSLIQPKIPETAGDYSPKNNQLNELVQQVYGQIPVAEFSNQDLMSKYKQLFLDDNRDLRRIAEEREEQNALDMFPDAPNPAAANQAYDNLFSDPDAMMARGLQAIEDVLNSPEGAVFRERGVPTPSEFERRLAEGERVIKGPFVNYISKNLGAEGNPTLKLARQGITIRDPEDIEVLSQYAKQASLAERRTKAGFPAEGSFNEERIARLTERDTLQREINELEAIRQPIFDQAHLDGVDPATIPAFAESTNPLRQKLRQLEKINEDIENIIVAANLENLEDSAVRPQTKKEALDNIRYADQQFFPSITKGAKDEKFYDVDPKTVGLLNEMGYKTLGRDLLKDIALGKAGDTSKLTIENYIREKGLAQKEERRESKAKEKTYRADLEAVLLARIKNDPTVQNFDGASVITLNSDTPMEVAIRDLSTDTAVLDHCVGECGTAPQGRKNILTGAQQQYEPLVDPLTGEKSKTGSQRLTMYLRDLQAGTEIASIRDSKTGFPAATIQFTPSGVNKFNIGYASGAKNKSVKPEYVGAVRDYLNSRADSIGNTGTNLANHTGIFDSSNPAEWRKVSREAGLTRDQAVAFEIEMDIPRFVTVKDVKKIAKEYLSADSPTQPANFNQYGFSPEDSAYGLFNEQVDTQNVPDFQGLERTVYGLRNREIIYRPIENLPIEVRQQARNATADMLQTLIDERRGEMVDGGELPDFEPDPTAVANRPGFFTQAERNALAAQGDPMPDNLDVTELLAEHADRLTTGQVRWLTDFSRRWDEDVDNTPAGEAAQEQMIREYDQWLSENRLEPDPGAVANRSVIYGDPYELAERYNVPPGMIRSILTEASGPTDRLVALQRESIEGADRFATLPNDNRIGVVALIDDILTERREMQQAAAPAQRPDIRQAQAPAIGDRVPREIQRLDDAALVADMPTAAIQEANEIAREAFNNNDFGPGGAPLEVFQRIIRTQRTGLHADSAHTTRELAARTLDTMYDTAQREARDFADDLITNYEDELEPPGTLQALQANIRDLEQNGETAWAMMFGEAADDTPWNPTLGNIFIRHLRQEAIDLDNRIRDAGADVDVDNEAEYLADAFRDINMDRDPADALLELQNTIRSLRRGEDGWDDALGMAADDTPWNPDLQRALIERLEALMDEFRDLDDPEEYAKGGEVKAPEKYHPDVQKALNEGRITAREAAFLNPLHSTKGNPNIGSGGVRDGASEKMMNYIRDIKSGKQAMPEGYSRTGAPEGFKAPVRSQPLDLSREQLRSMGATQKAGGVSEYANTYPAGAGDANYRRELAQALKENPDYQPYVDEMNKLDQKAKDFAKGGRAKKPRTSLVVTRKSPELAEMAYLYGGMVV